MFYNYIPSRKLSKILRRHPNSRQERPSSLSECLDTPTQARKGAWRLWLIVFLIFPTVYYLYTILYFQKYSFTNRSVKYSRRNMYNTSMQITERLMEVTTMNDDTELAILTPNPQDELPICFLNVSQLGKVILKKPPQKELMEKQYPMVSEGGYYAPDGCRSRHKIGVLVPYRDREVNLKVFLYNIHPFLMKQKLEYRIFVVEEKGADKFNKGRLFNAGFKEMEKFGTWHCIVFHDVDLLPLDERILYSCPMWPRHMCAVVVEQVDNPYYVSVFGGVTTMSPTQYRKVNGYSNLYWGWGGEDDDMFRRLRVSGIPVTRYNKTIARYTSLPHPASPVNPHRFKLLRRAAIRYKSDGLSNVEYKLDTIVEHHLYTHLLVDVNPTTTTTSENSLKLD